MRRADATYLGGAVAAAAALAATLAAVAVLARLGAPDGLIRILPAGAVALLAATAGAVTITSRLPAFFGADQQAPVLLGAADFGAAATGFVLGLNPELDAAFGPPALGAVLGWAAAGLLSGPLWRSDAEGRGGVDRMLARLPSRPARIVVGAAFTVVGAQVASAGVQSAALVLVRDVGASSRAATAIAAAVVCAMVAPGGLRGRIAASAAAAGAVLICSLAGVLVLHPDLAASGAAFAAKWAVLSGIGAPDDLDRPALTVAAAIGGFALGSLAPPGLGARGRPQASAMGLVGVIFLLALVGAETFVSALAPHAGEVGPLSSFLDAARLAPALALGALGVQIVARAAAPDRIGAPGIAGVRLARARLASVAVALFAALAVDRGFASTSHPFSPALAAAIAFAAPQIALLASARARAASAVAAVIAAVTVIAGLVWATGGEAITLRPIESALLAGAAGLAAGALAVGPRQRKGL